MTGSRPLVVGLSPPTADHAARGVRPFDQTLAGVRLAALLDVSADRLLEVVDAVHLSPHYLPNREAVPPGRWAHLARRHVVPLIRGRVVVCCGLQVAEALGVWWPGPARSRALCGFLAVCIPHPATVVHDPDVNTRTAAALQLAVITAAMAGPGEWTDSDADAFDRHVTALVTTTPLTPPPNCG